MRSIPSKIGTYVGVSNTWTIVLTPKIHSDMHSHVD